MANKEAIREWIEDLRSGKFPQTRRALHDDKGYCCLGVACETFRRVTGEGEWLTIQSGEDAGRQGFVVSPQDTAAPLWDVLPDGVQIWLGTDFNPNVKVSEGRWEPAAVLNDSQGCTFATIADLLEATYLAESPS